MKKKVDMFVDSDVIISSLISKKGAGYLIVIDEKAIKFISNYSEKEMLNVIDRLKLSKKEYKLTTNLFEKINIGQKTSLIKKQFANYVLDFSDSHIVAGAVKSKTKFLVTYNTRHYRIEKIKRDFNIITISPGLFIQYLRNRK